MSDPAAIPITLTVGQIVGAVGLAVSSVGGIVWALVKHIGKGFVEQVEEMEGRVLQLEGSMRIAVKSADLDKLEAKMDKHHVELRGELNSLGEELDEIKKAFGRFEVSNADVRASLNAGRERFERDDKRISRLERAVNGIDQQVARIEIAAGVDAKVRRRGDDDE